MHEYSDRLIPARRHQMDERQLSYLKFEQKSLHNKYLEYLKKAIDEAEMHCFLENNPALLPGLYDLHDGPLGDVVISKLKLADEYEADFAFITVNASTAQITFVNIESPKLKIFTDPGNKFTSGFNGSLRQSRDWTLWAQQNPAAVKDMFRDIYFKDVFKHQRVITRTIVVAGRRSEIYRNAQRGQRWAELNHEAGQHVVVSYDRLAEWVCLTPRMMQLICRPRGDVSRLLRSRPSTGNTNTQAFVMQ